MASPTKRSPPRVYRIILSVSDTDRAAEFYGTLLATEARHVGPDRVYLDCGPVILALVKTADGTSPEKGRSNFDNVYFATSELERVHERAKQLNCRMAGAIHDMPDQPLGEIVVRPWGERSFYVEDPFGNPLCFVDETTVFTGR